MPRFLPPNHHLPSLTGLLPRLDSFSASPGLILFLPISTLTILAFLLFPKRGKTSHLQPFAFASPFSWNVHHTFCLADLNPRLQGKCHYLRQAFRDHPNLKRVPRYPISQHPLILACVPIIFEITYLSACLLVKPLSLPLDWSSMKIRMGSTLFTAIYPESIAEFGRVNIQ